VTVATPGRAGHRVGDAVFAARVALVRKESAIERLALHPDARLQAAVDRGAPVAARVLAAHAEHLHSVALVEAALAARGIPWRAATRLDRRLAAWADLVVTVGGDGTFLSASHAVVDRGGGDGPPMLGVNSAPGSSVGYFCASDAAGFGQLFDAVRSGGLVSRPLWRMQVAINGRPLRALALNDVLLAHRVPAETTRYELSVDGVAQDQKSSGVWIATAAGSTAAIRSAGGAVLPIDSRSLQYRVRELMTWAVEGRALVGATFGAELAIVSRMQAGALYIDGSHLKASFGFGDRVTFSSAPRPLGWIAPPGIEARRQAVIEG